MQCSQACRGMKQKGGDGSFRFYTISEIIHAMGGVHPLPIMFVLCKSSQAHDCRRREDQPVQKIAGWSFWSGRVSYVSWPPSQSDTEKLTGMMYRCTG